MLGLMLGGRARIGLALLIGLALVVGCSKKEPPGKSTDTATAKAATAGNTDDPAAGEGGEAAITAQAWLGDEPGKDGADADC